MAARCGSKPLLLILIGVVVIVIGIEADAATVAYWRFEEGPAGTNVPHGADTGVYSPDLLDSSGNGNALSAWNSSQFAFRDAAAVDTVPRTGAANALSVKNITNNPTMWTTALSDWEPAQWTIEATFKSENGGHKTLVGRDSQGAATQGTNTNAGLAALYFQTIPDNGLAIKYVDKDGYWHEAVSASDAYQGYDYSSDPEGETAPWYSMAATSDGRYLRLYLFEHDNPEAGYQLIAETDMTVVNPGSTDTALSKGTGDGEDWDAGNITVGRGMYNGDHGDRYYGYLDEVRLSDEALDPSAFLFYEAQYAVVVVTPQDLVVHEEGPTGGELFFSLENPPADDVVLTLAEKHGRGQVTPAPTTLTFTPGNWNTPQAVYVEAVDDDVLENAEHPVPISVTVSSVGDTDYDGLEVAPVIVMVADNECGAWGYALGDFNTDCSVDFYDFVQFAAGWLDCSDPDQAHCTNFAN